MSKNSQSLDYVLNIVHVEGNVKNFFTKRKKLNSLMSYRGQSEHLPFANQTLKWFSTDNEKTFNYHLRMNYDRLDDLAWTIKRFDYTFNSLGFRCEEIKDSEPSIVFLGGSEVIGTGMPIKHIFPEIVAKELKLKCVNIAQSGASNDTVYRLASYWLPKLNAKQVVILSPPPYRIEVINAFLDNPIEFYVPEFHGKHQFFKTWLSCDDNSVLNEEKNRIAIDHICKTNKLKLLRFEDTDFETLDYGRDLVHKGIESHAKFAEKILDLL